MHAALGGLRFTIDWNYAGAAAELRRAEQLAPSNAKSRYQLSQVVLYMGQIDDAEALARQAVDFDP
ncbi:MAG: tetratricopeptide repeat protein, partial [Dokdonella sp.]